MMIRRTLFGFAAVLVVFPAIAFAAPEAICLDKTPQQLTDAMNASYPGKWITYRNTLSGYSLKMPPLLIPPDSDENKPHFEVTNWCGGDVGDSAPLAVTVQIFDAAHYAPAPLDDPYDPGKHTRQTPKQDALQCSKTGYHRQIFITGFLEYSTSYLERITVTHQDKLVEFSFIYTVMGAGSRLPEFETKTEHEIDIFKAANEKLECHILAGLHFK